MLYRYDGSSQLDILVTRMWADMMNDGDLQRIFGDADFPLNALLRLFNPPNECLLEIDEKGIWLAAWFEPFLAAAFLGYYTRPDRRATIGAYRAWRRVARAGLDAYGMLAGVTQQPSLLPILEAIGYTVIGKVPGLYHGNDAWIFTLTKEGFEHGNAGSDSLSDRVGSR